MKICNETGVFMEKKRTVIKVGTSTLTYENGKINYRRVEQLCKVLSDLQNRGEQVIFVSSGAIAVGMGKAGLDKRPTETKKKQALAAQRLKGGPHPGAFGPVQLPDRILTV